jgi:transcriptional regulator with XRE-family HTH domain
MGVISPSQIPRTPHTLRLRHLVEAQQRLEIAERIRELRERSPFTQPNLADRLGLTLRGYQKLEERGTTKWDRVEEIAAIYDVEADWIWSGKERGETPDPFATSPAAESDLARLERKIDRVLANQAKLLAAADLEPDAQAQSPPSPARQRRVR